MKAKAHKIPGTPVAMIVARGQADLFLQEVAEILPVKGAQFVGKLPEPLELLTPYAAAMATASKHPREAEALVNFIADPSVLPILEQDGLEPLKR